MANALDIQSFIKDILIHQGDDVEAIFDIKNAAGEPVDLSTGYTLKLQARESPFDTTPLISLTESAGLTPGAGTVKAAFAHTATAAYAFTEIPYELEVTKTADSLVKTVYSGKIRLAKEYAK